MKRIITLVLAALCGMAQAQQQTIDFGPAGGFGALRQYHNVPTSLCTQDPCESAGLLTIYVQGMQAWFGDQVDQDTGNFASYYIGQFLGDGQWSQLQKCVFDPATPYVGCTLNGEVLLINIAESSHRTCNRSGRGQGCRTLWTLTAGQILR